MPKGDTFSNDDLREYQDEHEGSHDSKEQIGAGGHQARNDYQDEGEPFGPLEGRDRSSKEDVPSTRSFDDEDTNGTKGEDE